MILDGLSENRKSQPQSFPSDSRSYFAASYARLSHHSASRRSSAEFSSKEYHVTSGDSLSELMRRSFLARRNSVGGMGSNLKINESGVPSARVCGSAAKMTLPR